MVGAGGVRHHEGLLEGGESGAELLRNPGEGPGDAVEGVAGAGTSRSRAAGGSGGDALGAAGVVVGLEDEAPLGGPLRGPAHGSSIIRRWGRQEEWGGWLRRPDGSGGGGGGGVGIEDLEGPTGVARKSFGSH